MKPRTLFKPCKKISPPVTTPKAQELIEKRVAISFLADRCKPPNENARPFRNQVSEVVGYAIRQGELKEVAGKVKFGELIAWGMTKPKYTKFLLSFPQLAEAREDELAKMGDSIHSLVLPATIEGCHQAIIAADERILELEKLLREKDELIAAQRPYVETGLKMRRPKRML
jgi:hypothetical protein